MTHEVRLALEPPDSASAIGLLAQYYSELQGRFPGGFDVTLTVAAPVEELVPPFGAFLIAWSSGQAVGCGAVRLLGSGMAEIKRMWTDSTFRGRGVGRRLLEGLEQEAFKLGARTVRLDTAAELTEARRLYASAGYREIPAYNENPYAAHWFEKHLL